MSRKRNQITIRPQQQFFWLGLTGLLFIGATVAGKAYGRGVWLFAAMFVAAVISFVGDVIVFDGQQLKRRGPLSLLGWLLLGRRREIALEEIETISSYVVGPGWRHRRLSYQTVISSAGLRWVIDSRQPRYRIFIKSLFCAVSPHQLDPRSSELLTYGPDREQLSLWKFAFHSPALMTPPQVWRRLANNLALDGQFEAAERYFRLASRQDPHNAHLLYELGRCLRLQATFEHTLAKDKAPLGRDRQPRVSRLRRADACLRLAGRLAPEDAALLERIGETFFEFHYYRLARRYFERALQIEPHRLRATLGLAEVALRSSKIARVVHFYRTAARIAGDAGDGSLAQLAESKADYYARLRADEGFLNAEVTRLNLLDHLKWARRGAMFAFLAAWLIHLFSYQLAASAAVLSREISATSAIIWLSTVTATYFFSQRRN